MSHTFDIAVIGSGPGGYIAALKAAQLGAKVAIVEKNTYFGGTCLNVGCIPSKALLASAELLHAIDGAKTLGVTVDGEVSFDWPAIQKRKTKTIAKLRGGIKGLFKARGVTVLQGHGRLAGANTFTVTDSDGATETHTAGKIILAVGSTPRRIPSWPTDPDIVCTSDEALHWATLPKSLIIVGGGVIGCEFACMMKQFGLDVTLIEMLPRLVPPMDADLGDALAAIFTKRGIALHLGATVETVGLAGVGVQATLADGTVIEAERMLVSVGRAAATDDCGLDTVGITTEGGFVPVDDSMQTQAPGVYCIGDANGRIQLAHAASAQGAVAAQHAMGQDVSDTSTTPWAQYTFPEVAGVGATEQELDGRPISVGLFPLGHLGKAMATEHTEGFVKTIGCRETGRLLGVHILGHNATEMIHAAAAMIGTQATTHDLAEMVFAHPTLSEAIKESAEDALGLALHLPPKELVRLVAEKSE